GEQRDAYAQAVVVSPAPRRGRDPRRVLISAPGYAAELAAAGQVVKAHLRAAEGRSPLCASASRAMPRCPLRWRNVRAGHPARRCRPADVRAGVPCGTHPATDTPERE